MIPTISAHNDHGVPIPGPDCENLPACITLIRAYLDFGEVGGANTPDNSSARFTGSQIREALKQLILTMRAHGWRHNKLLDKELELLRPPMPPEVLAAQEAMGPPLVLFIPWSSDQKNDAPRGMKAFREIRLTRMVGNPDPEVINPIQEALEKSRNERQDMRELLRFLWRCRNLAHVSLRCVGT